MKNQTKIAYFLIAVLTSFWLAIHLIYGDIFFDADQATVGLMGKDMAMGRAFPWTYYGQKYMLAVEAWLAGISFLVAGVSLTTLKLPLALVHIATSLMAFRVFRRDCHFSPIESLISTSPLIMPAVVTGAYLMGSNGANAYPAFYIIALWMLRNKSVWLGLLLGMAYFHREFVIFGAVALVMCDLFGLSEDTKSGRFLWWKRLISLVVAQGTYHGLVGLGKLNENFFGVGRPRAHWVGFAQFGENVAYFFSMHLPTLLGFNTLPVATFNLNSNVTTGVVGWGLINMMLMSALCAAMVFCFFRIRKISQRSSLGFPLYCLLAVVGQVTAYVLFIDANEAVLVRYLLLMPLAVLGIVGLTFVTIRDGFPKLRILCLSCALSLFGANFVANAGLLGDRIYSPWVDPRGVLAEHLISMGYQYGWAPYWDAYYLSFISNEKLIVAAADHTRMRRYRDEVKQHTSEAFVLTAEPDLCAADLTKQIEHWFVCPVSGYRGEIKALTQGR